MISVARTFLSEIANLSRQYRQIRHLFWPKSWKNRQFLGPKFQKFDPPYIFIAFSCINIFQNLKSLEKIIFFYKKLAALFRKKKIIFIWEKKPFEKEKKSFYFGRKFGENSAEFRWNSTFVSFKAIKSPISPVCLDFHQNRRFWSLEIADFRRLAIYRQAQIRIARRMSKIADLATYR